MNRKSLMIGLVFVAIAVAVSIWMARKPKPVEAEETSSPNIAEIALEAQTTAGITFAEVSEQPIKEAIKMTAVVSPDESRVAHVVPLSHGVVEQVLVQLGDRVQKGQPLLQYDNIELGESISEFQNMLGGVWKAEAQEEVANKSLERAKSLIAVEAISPKEFDVRKAEFQQAHAELESKKAEMARSEEKLHRFGMNDDEIKLLSGHKTDHHRTASHNTLRAPISGVITKFDVSRGEVISREKELFTIVDTSSIWALGDVYENDIQHTASGGECLVNVASYPTETFKGQITYLSDALDPASRTAKLRCVVPNPDGRLKLEMFATVSVPVKVPRIALSVPTTAVQEMDGQSVVFVQKDATHFEKRSVQTKSRDDQRTEIIGGLQSKEKVVAKGSFYVKSALLRDLMGEE